MTPSPEEIEAAAKAAYESETGRRWKPRPRNIKRQWRTLAEAALTAAEKARADELLKAKRFADEMLPEARTQPECDYCAAFQARDWQTVEATEKDGCCCQPETGRPKTPNRDPELDHFAGSIPDEAEQPHDKPDRRPVQVEEPQVIPDEAVEAVGRESWWNPGSPRRNRGGRG